MRGYPAIAARLAGAADHSHRRARITLDGGSSVTVDDAIVSAVGRALAPVLDELTVIRTELAELRRSQPPRLLTIAEAAATARVSPCTIRRWERDGVVRSVRRGARVLIDAHSLQPTSDDEITVRARTAREARS
jgi:hypothetical protein